MTNIVYSIVIVVLFAQTGRLQGEYISSVHLAALDVANHHVLIVILLSIKYSRTKCFRLVNTTLIFFRRDFYHT